MTRAAALALVLAAAPAAAEPARPSAALVIGEALGDDPARLDAARARLQRTHRLLDDARTRAVLEGFERSPPAEERTRDALGRAHERLRRFELPAVRQALDEAAKASSELEPTAAGRALAVEVAVKEAELALVAREPDAARRAMALALSVEPRLALDPERHPPTLVLLLERTRGAIGAAPRSSLRITSTPPGARVYAGGALAGETPLTVETLASGPQLVWISHDGYRTRALRADAGPDAQVSVALEPLDEERRLRPLVEAVRQTDGERRRQAALALAAALDVDAVAVLEPRGDASVIYARVARALPPPAPLVAAPALAAPAATALAPLTPPPRKPWYRRGWIWGVVAGAAVAATVTGLAVYYTSRESLTWTCCK